jgi:hypothetical protein
MHAYILYTDGPGNQTHYPGIASTMLYQLTATEDHTVLQKSTSTALGSVLVTVMVLMMLSLPLGTACTGKARRQGFLLSSPSSQHPTT